MTVFGSKKEQKVNRNVGDRIRWNVGRSEYHGIVLAYIGYRKIKAFTPRQMFGLVKGGVVPKIGLEAASDLQEGERVVNRAGVYVVLRITIEPKKMVKARITTIPADKMTYKSQHKMDTYCIIREKARYREYRRRLRLGKEGI